MPIIKNGHFITEIRHGTRRVASAYQGNRKIWQDGPIEHAPETAQWFSPGRYEYYIPFWAGYLDVVRLGAGGGGSAGNSAFGGSGEGGRAGIWALHRVDVRTLGTRLLFIDVGAGGAEGRAQGWAPGSPGGSSRVYTSSGTIGAVATGGAGGIEGGNANGQASGNRELHGRTYTGGTGGAGGSGAGRPGGRGSGGGGGAGGIFGQYREGGPGGNGAVWITAMTRYEVEN